MNDFLYLLSQAAQLVEGAYPGSKFYEADGRPSTGSASEESEVNAWRFVFLGPPQGRTTSVFIEYGDGKFGSPTLHNDPFLGDHVIVPPHWPIKMTLPKAIKLKNEAGYTLPFRSVNLRWPLSPDNTEPLYIFGDASGLFIFVGVESSTVTRFSSVRDALPSRIHTRADGDQVRLCTAQGLVYKAYRRRYLPEAPDVLTLMASCYYDVAPWELFFLGEAGSQNKFKLMEKVPKHFYLLKTFYAPCSCSHYGVPGLNDEITIADAHGEHRVKVEDIG